MQMPGQRSVARNGIIALMDSLRFLTVEKRKISLQPEFPEGIGGPEMKGFKNFLFRFLFFSTETFFFCYSVFQICAHMFVSVKYSSDTASNPRKPKSHVR